MNDKNQTDHTSVPGRRRCPSAVRIAWHSLVVSIAVVVVLEQVTGIARDKALAAESGSVTIHANFPGGNVMVTQNAGQSVHVAPDLRGDNPWFYWCFEARAVKPGQVEFVFPDTVAGFKNGAIGYQGPAISEDRGRSWRWMGADSVDGGRFSYLFSQRDRRVRFAVTIPYVQSDLDAFLRRHDTDPQLKSSVLTKSRHGRDVELLLVGKPRPDAKPVLLTARHHAAETMASYVVEGFLEEALSAWLDAIQDKARDKGDGKDDPKDPSSS